MTRRRQHSEDYQPTPEQLANRRRLWLVVGMVLSTVLCWGPPFVCSGDTGILSTRTFEVLPLHVVLTQTDLQSGLVMKIETVWLWGIVAVEALYLLACIMALLSDIPALTYRMLRLAKVAAVLFYAVAAIYIVVLSGRMFVTLFPSWPFVVPLLLYMCARVAQRTLE